MSGGGVGSPAIGSDGTVYVPSGVVGDDVGFLYAVNPDCTQKWVFQLPGPPASTAPALAADGTIYVHANGPANLVSIETLTAINPDGSFKWQFEFNGGGGIFTSDVQSSPAIAPDGTIYVGSIDTNLYALNPDKSIKWAVSPTVSSISSSPAIGADGTIYVADATCTLFAFAPDDGDILWDFPLSAGTCYDASPAVGTDGTIYIGGPFEEDLTAINPDGTLKCEFSTGWRITSTPAIAADGTIYVGSDGLYAVNPDCSEKWRFPSTTVLFSSASPVIGADGIIYWRQTWTAYAVNPDGTQKWSLGVDPSAGGMLDPSGAIGADGVLYQACGGYSVTPRVLRAIGPPVPPTPTPTPTPTPVPPPDQDGDTIPDTLDNCPTVANPNQAAHDSDLYGDACDKDDDGDGFPDTKEIARGSDPLNLKCYNASNDDSSDDIKVNDGCPKMSGASETGTQCGNATDDDGDTWVNDGCPVVGTRSEGSTPEVCDGLDNDGDTQVDEGLPDTHPGGSKDCLDPLVDTDGDTIANPSDPDDDNDGWTDAEENWMGTDSLDACPDNTSDDALPPDIKNDRKVNILDVGKFRPVIGSELGGSGPNDYNYDRRYDLKDDAKINILDVTKIRPYMGQTCTG
jgi:outer membrane protein assembly factor BamB